MIDFTEPMVKITKLLGQECSFRRWNFVVFGDFSSAYVWNCDTFVMLSYVQSTPFDGWVVRGSDAPAHQHDDAERAVKTVVEMMTADEEE